VGDKFRKQYNKETQLTPNTGNLLTP